MMINYNCYGTIYKLNLYRTTYQNNGNLAILALIAETTEDAYEGEQFDVLTVNTDRKLPDNMACLDINNLPGIDKTLVEAGLATATGLTINPGGFVNYPVYKIDINQIPKMEENDDEEDNKTEKEYELPDRKWEMDESIEERLIDEFKAEKAKEEMDMDY